MPIASYDENVSDILRKIIISGDEFNGGDIAEQYGRSRSLSNNLVKEFKCKGYKFERGPNNTFARPTLVCINPDYQMTEADWERWREFRSQRHAAQQASKAKTRGGPVETPEERKRRLDRERKARARDARRDTAPQRETLPDLRPVALDQYEVDARRVEMPAPPAPPAMNGVSFDTFRNAGLIGVEGFGKDPYELLNYETTLNTPPPTLGQKVQIFAMAVLDNGALRLGVQDGEQRWVLDCVAAMERPTRGQG